MRSPSLFALLLVSFVIHEGRSIAAEETTQSTTLPAHLSLEEALRIFRAHGLDLLIADAAVQGAQGDAKAAGAVPNPTWSLDGSYSFALRGGPAPDPAWGVTASLGDGNALEDSISGKRGLRLRVAHAALEAAKLARSDAQRTIEYQVKAQYMSALLARDLLDFAIETEKSAQQTYDLMQLRYKAGAVSEADEAKVEAAKLEAEQNVDSAAQALRVAKLGLAFLLGVRGRVPEFHVAEDLPPFRVLPAISETTPDALIEEAFSNRPDLRMIARQKERSAAQVSLQKRLRVPDLALGVSYQQQAGYDKNAAQPPTVSFGVGGTLPVFYFQRGEIMRAEADLRTVSLQHDRIAAQVSNDVQAAWTNVESTRKLLERMQSRLLDRTKRTRDLVEIQYRKGAASLLEFLDAQRQWIATNGEYYQDLANYWTAVFQLEQAIGRELR